jgi:hypothetical protein
MNDIMDDDNRGVWIGAILLIFALIIGILIGVAVMGPIAERELASMQDRLERAEAQRDKALKEATFWRSVLRRLVEGEQPGTIMQGRVSDEN